ncbi:MAG: hypothetical protein ACK41O_10785 [Runella zeae]
MTFYDYFQSYKGHFWQWEEGSNVLALQNGNTIAYRNYVINILEKLYPENIPPFGALLLVIIATNPLGAEDLQQLEEKFRTYRRVPYGSNDDLADALSFLLTLTLLPESYKTQEKRVWIFQTIFQSCHNRLASYKRDQFILRFQNNDYEVESLIIQKDFSSNVFYKDIRTLALINKQFPTPDSILAKLAEIPEIGEELLVTSPTNESNWLDDLIDTPQTFHVGALIKHIWAGLSIPFYNNISSQRSLGGVADLSNKGDLNRLLISEFANDELIFLSRLANNEALYLNPDIPPQSTPLERIILIDISIKNWGSPKIISYALLLALAKHPQTDISYTAFIVGKSYHEISMTPKDSLIANLQKVDVSLHPAEGLALFFNQYKLSKHSEVIFITSHNTLKERDLQKVVNQYKALFGYWIHIDSEGNIDLYKRHHISKKHIQHLSLPLKKLWKKEKPQTPSSSFSPISYYPILLPHSSASNLQVIVASNQEIFCIQENYLLQKCSPEDDIKGLKIVYFKELPFKPNKVEIGHKADDYLVLLFEMQHKKLALISLKTGKIQLTTFSEWNKSKHDQFIYWNGSFFYLGNHNYWEITQNSQRIEIINKINDSSSLDWYQSTDWYKAYQQMVSQPLPSGKCWKHNSILKNIDGIFINDNHRLVLNNHELTINQNGSIQFSINNKKKLIEAEKSTPNIFIFPNQSSIFINRVGLIVLQPNPNTIYYELVLQELGEKKIEALQIIKEKCKFSVSIANDGTIILPCIIQSNLVKSEADTAVASLLKILPSLRITIVPQGNYSIFIPTLLGESLGIATEIDFAGNKYYLSSEHFTKPVLSSDKFWHKYIAPYLQSVINHGDNA